MPRRNEDVSESDRFAGGIPAASPGKQLVSDPPLAGPSGVERTIVILLSVALSWAGILGLLWLVCGCARSGPHRIEGQGNSTREETGTVTGARIETEGAAALVGDAQKPTITTGEHSNVLQVTMGRGGYVSLGVNGLLVGVVWRLVRRGRVVLGCLRRVVETIEDLAAKPTHAAEMKGLKYGILVKGTMSPTRTDRIERELNRRIREWQKK